MIEIISEPEKTHFTLDHLKEQLGELFVETHGVNVVIENIEMNCGTIWYTINNKTYYISLGQETAVEEDEGQDGRN